MSKPEVTVSIWVHRTSIVPQLKCGEYTMEIHADPDNPSGVNVECFRGDPHSDQSDFDLDVLVAMAGEAKRMVDNRNETTNA